MTVWQQRVDATDWDAVRTELDTVGCALTGLPLLFSDEPWAAALARSVGGFETTTLIHHLCAVVMIAVFVTHVIRVFVRALRSGHPVASAIDLLTHEMEDPMGSEFGVVSDEASYGADLHDALQAMAERWDNPDMRMFVVSLSLQSETGGNLAEILENLADVIRARAAMYMKVRALSSEGRLTGFDVAKRER